MIVYAPKSKKIREKILLSVSLVFAAALFGAGCVPAIPLPAVWQFFCVCFLTVAIVVVGRYLMRDYVYRIEPSENEPTETDFVITERYGRRSTVVCRIALSEIRRAERATKETLQAFSAEKKNGRVYHYTAEMKPRDLCLLTVENGDGICRMRISADDALLLALSGR